MHGLANVTCSTNIINYPILLTKNLLFKIYNLKYRTKLIHKINKKKTTENIRALSRASPRHISAFWLTILQRYPRIWSRTAASSTRKWSTRYVGELKWPDRLCVSAQQSNYCWINLAVFTGPCRVLRLIDKYTRKSNKAGNVRVNVTMRRVGVTTVVMETQ
jgi:hypothetical protein